MAASVDSLEKELDRLLAEAGEALAQADRPEHLEQVRIIYLGRRGELNRYFALIKEEGWSAEEKGRLGRKLNAVKQELTQALEQRQSVLGSRAPRTDGSLEDRTLPGHLPTMGRVHPVTQVISEIVTLFRSLGFSVVEGPEVETEYYNFEALNIPADHPSREGFDTFYIKGQSPLEMLAGRGAGTVLGGTVPESRFLLRSHTSPVQIRFMETHQPPFQILVPGRVFRPDAVDASHCFQFHQVEGLAVGEGLTFGDLKGVLTTWAQGMFGRAATLRFRPHYFPFTEPSAEADLGCIFCQRKGCRVCGQKGWLEILGCGMVHPAVFKAVRYLPGTVGFAFGMGVERIAMLKYGIEDIRLFFENDLRFLQQFI